MIATAARAAWNARPLYEPSGTATSPATRGCAPLPRTRTSAEKLPSRYFTGMRSALRTSSTSPIGTRAPRSYASAFAPLAPMPSTRPAKLPYVRPSAATPRRICAVPAASDTSAPPLIGYPDATPSLSATTPSNDGPRVPRTSASPNSESVPAWSGSPAPRSAATGSAGADTKNAPPASAATARPPPIEPSTATTRSDVPLSTAIVPATLSTATPRTRPPAMSAPVVCSTMWFCASVARTGPWIAPRADGSDVNCASRSSAPS